MKINYFLEIHLLENNKAILINVTNIALVDNDPQGTIICFSSDLNNSEKILRISESFDKLKSDLENTIPMIQLSDFDTKRLLLINVSKIDWIEAIDSKGSLICFNYSINGFPKQWPVIESVEEIKPSLIVLMKYEFPDMVISDRNGLFLDKKTGKKVTDKEYRELYPESLIIFVSPRSIKK